MDDGSASAYSLPMGRPYRLRIIALIAAYAVALQGLLSAFTPMAVALPVGVLCSGQTLDGALGPGEPRAGRCVGLRDARFHRRAAATECCYRPADCDRDARIVPVIGALRRRAARLADCACSAVRLSDVRNSTIVPCA